MKIFEIGEFSGFLLVTVDCGAIKAAAVRRWPVASRRNLSVGFFDRRAAASGPFSESNTPMLSRKLREKGLFSPEQPRNSR